MSFCPINVARFAFRLASRLEGLKAQGNWLGGVGDPPILVVSEVASKHQR